MAVGLLLCLRSGAVRVLFRSKGGGRCRMQPFRLHSRCALGSKSASTSSALRNNTPTSHRSCSCPSTPEGRCAPQHSTASHSVYRGVALASADRPRPSTRGGVAQSVCQLSPCS